MQKIIYVPPGGNFEDAQKRVVLGAEEPFILASVSGLGGGEADIISSETVGMDGEVYHGTHIPPRFVKCAVSIKGQNRADLYAERMRLAGLLRPQGSQKGDLYYENDHVSVKIKAVPKVSGDFEKRIKLYLSSDIEFYCPNPYWSGLSEHRANIANVEGAGLVLPCEFNSIVLMRTINELDINNSGTVRTPVRITIIGPSESPVITNQTVGKAIRLRRALSSGERLVINTERGNKSVKLYSNDTETDAFGYLHPLSKFWELEPGTNHIVYGNGGQAETSIHINWFDRYAGV